MKRIVLKKIDLINLESISHKSWIYAIELISNIDKFDAPFVALALELEGFLWTGDKKLRNGLSSKKIDWILNSKEIKEIRNKK